jgi:hypothetical protein
VKGFVGDSLWQRKIDEAYLTPLCGMEVIGGFARQTSLTFGTTGAWRKRAGLSISPGVVGVGLMEVCRRGRRRLASANEILAMIEAWDVERAFSGIPQNDDAPNLRRGFIRCPVSRMTSG